MVAASFFEGKVETPSEGLSLNSTKENVANTSDIAMLNVCSFVNLPIILYYDTSLYTYVCIRIYIYICM